MSSRINLANPALRTLAATVAFAFAGQGAAASVFVPAKSEKYYDLCGSLGFLSCTALSLYFPSIRAKIMTGAPIPSLLSFHPRQLIMSGLTILWAGRLGSFLYARIKKHGSDNRFDDIKQSPIQFTGAWMAQATWISLTALPVFTVNAIPGALQPALGRRDAIGLAIWLAAFAYEITADRQKSEWRRQRDAKEHDEQFISSGVWAQSRHPNYFGEVSLWVGQAILASTAISKTPLLGPYSLGLAAASPLLEYGLIRYVSGVPLLEKSADKKFADNKAYQEYKKNTPVFFPKLL